VQNIRLHNNLKKFSKVGFKEAKAWMERRSAAMKNGVPQVDAAELAQDWSSSLEHNELSGLDTGIAEIEAINLAKQYTRWHVKGVGDMEQMRPDGVFK
jgi:hypothetical protein